MPMRFSTSMSSWISNMLSKLNKYSNLREEGGEGRRISQGTEPSLPTFQTSEGTALTAKVQRFWKNKRRGEKTLWSLFGLVQTVLMSNNRFSCWLIVSHITPRVLLHPNEGCDLSFKKSKGGILPPRKWHTSDTRLKSHVLIAGDAAVDDGFLAGVDDDEGKVDDGIGRGGSVCLQFCLPVPLHQILKCYLLRNETNNV